MSQTARRVRARRVVALVVAATLANGVGVPRRLLFAVEDFRYATVVQAGLGGDVAGREAGVPGTLEALAARGAGFVPLALRLLKGGLETAQLSSGFLLGSAHAGRSLRAGSVPSSTEPRKGHANRRNETTAPRNGKESRGSARNSHSPPSRASGSTKGKGRHLPALLPMRPTRIELATFGLKDRRSLVPVKGPLTTELRAP